MNQTVIAKAMERMCCDPLRARLELPLNTSALFFHVRLPYGGAYL